MDVPVLANQQKLTLALMEAKRPAKKWWMIGMDDKRESENSMHPAQLDNDNDVY